MNTHSTGWLRVALGLACSAAGLTLAGCASAVSRSGPGEIAYDIKMWEFGPWEGRQLTTEHYVIYTTVTEPRLLETFPELVEGSYRYYQDLVPPAHDPPEPMRVFLFRTRAQWAYMTRKFVGPRAPMFLKIHNGGYSEDGVTIAQYVAHQITFPLLAHEGFHQYLELCVRPGVPAWLNEGMAVVSECQRWSGRGLEEFDPWYNPSRRNRLIKALAKDRLFSVQELLDTHAGEVIHETSEKVATYYAQVWSLMLFLWEGADGKYAGGFRELCAALGDPQLDERLRAERIWTEKPSVSRGEALFRSFITDNLEAFEQEYLAFLRQRLTND